MNVLTIDTSSATLSLGLFQNAVLLSEHMEESHNDHASILMPNIESLLADNGMHVSELQKIIVANGPGSYTGTRIGVTTAKTLAWALGIEIQAVSTLLMYTMAAMEKEGLICPLMDARRKSIYTALYSFEDGHIYEVMEEQFMTIESWVAQLKEIDQPVTFISPHMDVIEADLFIKNHDKLDMIGPSPMFLYEAAAYASKGQSVHEVNPNYIRVTEAERNLRNKQIEANNND